MVSSTAAAAHRWHATSESAETQLLLLPSHSGLVNVSVLSQGILVSLRYHKFNNHQLATTFDDIQYGHRNSLQLVSSTISTVYQLRSTSLCFCCHIISRQDISSKSYNNSFIYDSAIEIDTDLVCRVWFLASTDVGDPRCRTVIVSTVAAPGFGLVLGDLAARDCTILAELRRILLRHQLKWNVTSTLTYGYSTSQRVFIQ